MDLLTYETDMIFLQFNRIKILIKWTHKLLFIQPYIRTTISLDFRISKEQRHFFELFDIVLKLGIAHSACVNLVELVRSLTI